MSSHNITSFLFFCNTSGRRLCLRFVAAAMHAAFQGCLVAEFETFVREQQFAIPCFSEDQFGKDGKACRISSYYVVQFSVSVGCVQILAGLCVFLHFRC